MFEAPQFSIETVQAATDLSFFASAQPVMEQQVQMVGAIVGSAVAPLIEPSFSEPSAPVEQATSAEESFFIPYDSNATYGQGA